MSYSTLDILYFIFFKYHSEYGFIFLFFMIFLFFIILDQSRDDSSLSLSDHFERKSKTNDLFQYVFASVAGKKGHVTMADVLAWDFTQVHNTDSDLTLFDLI